MSCCPPNLARLLLSLEKYIYTQSFINGRDTIHIHLLIESEATFILSDGTQASIQLESSQEGEGAFLLSVEKQGAMDVDVMIRIPEWAPMNEIEVYHLKFLAKRES